MKVQDITAPDLLTEEDQCSPEFAELVLEATEQGQWQELDVDAFLVETQLWLEEHYYGQEAK